MNRQLPADSGMSLPDYDVLTALSVADGGRMQITVLAAASGSEDMVDLDSIRDDLATVVRQAPEPAMSRVRIS